MNKLKRTIAFLTAFLGISSLPIENGKSSFSDDQLDKMKKKLGEDTTKKVVAAIDKEASAILEQQDTDNELVQIREELQEALRDTNMSEEEALEAVAGDNSYSNLKSGPSTSSGTGEGTQSSKDPAATAGTPDLSGDIKSLAKKLTDALKRQDKLIEQLINEPENDSPEAKGQISNQQTMKHSKTHLFSSGQDYNAFANRPWNQRAAGMQTEATDFNDRPIVEKLNKDMKDYWRDNPEVIRSLQNDRFGLPEYWHKEVGVRDQTAEASIVTGEISQARTSEWLPKNKQRIKPETRKVYPIKIDMEWSGYRLQKLEQSWLSKIVNSGSQPYKIPFVRFLIDELFKQARVENRKACVLGVYTPTPQGWKEPGRMIDRQDGLLINIYRGYAKGKFKVAEGIPAPTPQNILDHVEMVIEKNLQEADKNQANLVYNLCPTHLRWYKNRYRQVHGTELDFTDAATRTIPNYENIRFETLVDLEGLDFHFITYADNISIDEDVPAEKLQYKLEMLKRNIYAFGDYKMGCGPRLLGTKVSDEDPEAFKKQVLWTNGQPMFKSDFSVPVYETPGGELEMAYKNMHVTDGAKDEVTEINGAYKGEVIKIKANDSATGSINNSGKFSLTGGKFEFDSDKTLVLYFTGTQFVELDRYDNDDAAIVNEPFEFDGDTVDVENGLEQKYVAEEPKTLAAIENGVEGMEITLYGDDDTNFLTVDSTAADTVTLTGGSSYDLKKEKAISFVFVNGKFIETSRV